MTDNTKTTDELGSRATDEVGARTLTEADLTAIRDAVLDTVPISFMDTQKIVLENKQLKEESLRLKGWIALLVDKIKDETGLFKHTVEDLKPGHQA